jgi:pimeloyl-ACP methyl ester carboxylesterase
MDRPDRHLERDGELRRGHATARLEQQQEVDQAAGAHLADSLRQFMTEHVMNLWDPRMDGATVARRELDVAQFVLVPGIWLGGWVWRKVGVRLAAAGHSTWTPTLTGLGERSHLQGPWVGLETHVDDVVNVIEREGLDDVVLVGHGYGGTVAASVADRVPERVARLVLVASSVPQDTRAVIDVAAPWLRSLVREVPGSKDDAKVLAIPPAEELGRDVAVSDMSAADRTWFWANAAAHPVRALEGPVTLSGAGAAVPTTYVRCLVDEMVSGPVRELPIDWEVRSVRAGHWPMVTRPDELTDVLREAAEAAVEPAQSMATMR